MDKRKFNKGTIGNKGGRPKNAKFTTIISKYFDEKIEEFLKDPKVKSKLILSQSKQMQIENTKYFYLLNDSSNGWIKMGYTTNIKQRIRTYLAHNQNISLKYAILMQDADSFEKQMHDYYSNYRVKGEWYRLEECQIMNVITKASRVCYL